MSGADATGMAEAPPIVNEALASPGRPLDATARAFFEPRMLCDLARVRLHDGAVAESSASAIGARAYTLGSDIVFGRGEYNPGSETGRRVLAHELSHVLQQGAGEPSVIQRLTIYAGGFARPYASDAEEIGSFGANTWAPSSFDFAHTAGHADGQTAAASTPEGLIDELRSVGLGSISELELIGHAVKGAFVLSGTIAVQENGVLFDSSGALSSQWIASNRSYLWARDRFAKDAVITLYGCYSGADQELLDALSQAFGVCVRGFTGAIDWCISADPTGAIVSRGRTRLGSDAPSGQCLNFVQNIRSLTPDAESCAGAVEKQGNPKTGD